MLVILIISDVIYVIGGYIKGAKVNSLQSYDMTTQKWATLQPMAEKRDSQAVCLQGDRIIVAGGHNGSEYLDTCESFDTKSKRFVFNFAVSSLAGRLETRRHRRARSIA